LRSPEIRQQGNFAILAEIAPASFKTEQSLNCKNESSLSHCSSPTPLLQAPGKKLVKLIKIRVFFAVQEPEGFIAAVIFNQLPSRSFRKRIRFIQVTDNSSEILNNCSSGVVP